MHRAFVTRRQQRKETVKMKLSFESHSLLYGISYLWLIIQIVSPYFIWPNFSRSRSEHVLKSRPKLLQYMDSIGRKTRAIRWSPRFVLVAALMLNLAMLVLHNDIQNHFLKSLGITNTSRLSYKVLYYFPIILVSKLTDDRHDSAPHILTDRFRIREQ